jgi:hypothetical protein
MPCSARISSAALRISAFLSGALFLTVSTDMLVIAN